MSSILRPKNVPVSTGVYIFSRNKTPIYIGKATDLKNRITSYFRKNAGEKVSQLLNEATKLEWIETPSEVTAFLREAKLIKKYRPRYNYLLRDDKNYFYVGITKEDFPRIFITHQPSPKFRISKFPPKARLVRGGEIRNSARYVGPFTSGTALKTVLRLLRKIFPYCTCKNPHKRPCLNAEIGRCPSFCCDKSKFQIPNPKFQNEYNANIRNILLVLGGRKRKLLQELKREMKTAARDQDFERAASLRDQILGLENIFGHRMALETGRRASDWPKIQRTLQAVLKTARTISRVEGYDISNISGTEATGSLVVFINGFSEKSEYRKFKIKTVTGPNDVMMLKEVISRRLGHREWPYPDLMLIDGGKPQLNAAMATLKFQIPNSKFQIHVMALAKREEELYIPSSTPTTRLSFLPPHTAHFLQRVRDESHRFAKKYHHKLRELSYRG